MTTCRICNEETRPEDPAVDPVSGACCYCGYWDILPGFKREQHRQSRRNEAQRRKTLGASTPVTQTDYSAWRQYTTREGNPADAGAKPPAEIPPVIPSKR